MDILQEKLNVFNSFAGDLSEQELKSLNETDYKLASKLDRLKIFNEYLDSYKQKLQTKIEDILYHDGIVKTDQQNELQVKLSDASKKYLVEYISKLHSLE